MRELLEHADRVLIGGHRGSACRYPENSIEAMEHGLLSGADYLEIDIQLTRDGVPVVYHDTALEKRTALHGYVHEHTLDRLRENCPGLCTFEEAMRWGSEREAWFALEIKTVPLDMQEVNFRLLEAMVPVLEKTGMKKNDAEKALKAFVDVVTDELVKGEKIQLVGFGTFEVSERPEREGRNPRTGETMKIAASKAPKFKAGKALKDMINA